MFGIGSLQKLFSIEKHVLVKKIFTNELNMILPQWTWVKKTVCGVETHWLLGKEKVTGAVVSREGDADSWDMKEPITIDFFETSFKEINSDGFCKQCFLLPTP